MEFNLADLFEAAADAVPDRTALVVDDRRLTYRQLDERSTGLAHHLQAAGVGAGDHVAVYGQNCTEWMEAFLAVCKLRARVVNVNYRYVEEELRYLLGNAEVAALVVQRRFAPMAAAVHDAMPGLRHVVVIDDGSGETVDGAVGAVDFEEAVAAGSPERDFGPRSGDDVYLLYTGGTTGMPKGVLWRSEDVFYALGGGFDALTGEPIRRPEELSERARASGGPMVMMHTAPLMHGAAQWGSLRPLFAGDTAILVSKFDAEAVWSTVERERVNVVGITGDAMARPLADALEAHPGRWDLSSLLALSSTAAVFSPVVKAQLLRMLPNVVLTDAVGATEGGMHGLSQVSADTLASGGGPRITPQPETAVLDDDLRPVEPGSGVVGRLARTGHIPLGYFKDPAKTAATFVEIEGRRWVVPGDLATVEADGTITLLGRGSICINTGGEKVYPEEVEAVLKGHPDVFDALVVGVPDERWGEQVTAIVQPRPGRTVTLDDVDRHCRSRIAGFKVPRRVEVVDRIARLDSGKPDYTWAKSLALASA